MTTSSSQQQQQQLQDSSDCIYYGIMGLFNPKIISVLLN